MQIELLGHFQQLAHRHALQFGQAVTWEIRRQLRRLVSRPFFTGIAVLTWAVTVTVAETVITVSVPVAAIVVVMARTSVMPLAAAIRRALGRGAMLTATAIGVFCRRLRRGCGLRCGRLNHHSHFSRCGLGFRGFADAGFTGFFDDGIVGGIFVF